MTHLHSTSYFCPWGVPMSHSVTVVSDVPPDTNRVKECLFIHLIYIIDFNAENSLPFLLADTSFYASYLYRHYINIMYAFYVKYLQCYSDYVFSKVIFKCRLTDLYLET